MQAGNYKIGKDDKVPHPIEDIADAIGLCFYACDNNNDKSLPKTKGKQVKKVKEQ